MSAKQNDGGAKKEPTAVHAVDPALSDVRFLTVAEVAGVMRVSKMTVYRMVHGGELPAVRVGRSFRVPEQAVHDYLRAAYIEAG
jgi:excisionase family DNA binding protein